jgi:hypothetical protein
LRPILRVNAVELVMVGVVHTVTEVSEIGGAPVGNVDARRPAPMRSLLLVVLVACGGGSSDPDSLTPDAPAGVDDAPDPMPTKQALVQIGIEPPEFSGTGRVLIQGGFVDRDDARCRRRTVANCEVSDCPQSKLGIDHADPGKLTFSPAFGGVLSFSPGASHLFFSVDQIPWAANETITLTAAGKDVPGFTANVTSPRTLDAGEGRPLFGPPVSKAQPFTATWVPLSENALLVLRQGRDTSGGEFEILVHCKVAGAAGTATVPAAALSDFLPEASGGLSLQVTAHAMRETTVVAGDFGVTYRAIRSFGQTIFHEVTP